ncbi:acetyltransferase, GNAT family [Cyanobium sp. PCC 7001]|uniref:MSMEG_0567/Sll0786 family nitrogen starvation N-acetyltransferase n=1 Tax=Cyanobium sp. PCC 7001 TaxID=180281 RepID=UPI00018057DE|nr:MSMEG_0567/Sll0786 family nitrogen starvation N-acetyltransferase [Cyanobium sp. PCC 7001]EDY37451.1 acetyltransferase, GNAT family [Cyanobium sp. PCC 7001]
MFFIDPSSHDIGRSPSSAPAAFTPSVRWGIPLEAEDFELSPTASSQDFSFHVLGPESRLLPSYWDLRSRIFCEEQHLFEASDRDELDRNAHPIVALSHHSARAGEAVGVVRIVELSPRVWQGGRLGVDADFRRLNQIGKGLIWKAVTTAHGWGCDRFLATVQRQNVPFFRRLHWRAIEALEIRGLPHQLMEADLSYYRPSRERRPLEAAA